MGKNSKYLHMKIREAERIYIMQLFQLYTHCAHFNRNKLRTWKIVLLGQDLMATLKPLALGLIAMLTLLPDYNIFHFPIISLQCLKTMLFQLDLMLNVFQLYIFFWENI